MALKMTALEESTQAPSLKALLPETIPSATGNGQPQSPVDVIIALRKELAEFQKVSSKEALREELRAACKEALQRGAVAGCPDGPSYPNIEPIVEYLTERGLIRPKLSRARRRRLESSLPPSERSGS
jgi:hypothetical protein